VSNVTVGSLYFPVIAQRAVSCYCQELVQLRVGLTPLALHLHMFMPRW